MIKRQRGTEDILPEESALWRHIEDTVYKTCKNFGYGEIRTPVFEATELFQRGVGDTTDVVQKEMYTFEDKGGRSITLRPEGTAAVARSFVEHSLFSNPQPTKLYYIMSFYRYEKPQAGRLREFHQFGVECFGAGTPATDAEVISLAYTLLKNLGVSGLTLNINSIGCPECRSEYSRALTEYFSSNKDKLCDTCKERLNKNPMRILDCKSEICKQIAAGAPKMLDYLCDECREHFEKLKNQLEIMGIEYEVNPKIVRGLDYYTKTVFEFIADIDGAKSTVCGGGRYDGLIEEIGGKPTVGIGFGMGIERLILQLKAQNSAVNSINTAPEVFVAAIGEAAENFAQKLVFELRNSGVSAERDLLGRSLKAQMKYADKLSASYSIVLGDNEINSGEAVIKNMNDGSQNKIALSAQNIADILHGGENYGN